MANAATTLAAPSRLDRLARRTEMLFLLGFIGIIAVLLLPVPAPILSTLLALNLSVSLLVLLACVYAKEPLEFSAFPSLLLVTTMMRLALNVASTRLILLTGSGGSVIETFGQFVVGGNFVVGVVVFAIIVVIQLVVVTKGAGRISEVAARFVLDAMPGKQMAIDADLNAGLITEDEARARRKKIEAEAEFYGSMDGASKFVKGDAIAGIIIIVINIVAGFIIGMTMMGMDAQQSLTVFTILTIGDGLVSQIPSLLITIGSGLLVTKTRSDRTVGEELGREFYLKPKALYASSAMVLLIGLVPGMPILPFALIAGIIFFLAGHAAAAMRGEADDQMKAKQSEQQKPVEEKPEDLLRSDRVGVEIGYRLIPLVDRERGGTLLDRITALRRQLARESGMLVPPIRIKDNIQLPPNAYRILIYGQTVAEGDLHADRLLAIDSGAATAPVPGIPTKEPAFRLDATWIEPGRRAEAEGAGHIVTDPASVFITHLTQILRLQAAAILNREDVQAMVSSLKQDAPALAKEIEANAKLGTVQKVIAQLLEEKVPVTNLEKIMEAIADQPTADPLLIAEAARNRLGRALVASHLDAQGRLQAIILEPASEARLSQAIAAAGSGGQLAINPQEASALVDQLGRSVEQASAQGREVVLLTTASLRRQLRQIVGRFLPELPVLSYGEIGTTPVEVAATVALAKPA